MHRSSSSRGAVLAVCAGGLLLTGCFFSTAPPAPPRQPPVFGVVVPPGTLTSEPAPESEPTPPPGDTSEPPAAVATAPTAEPERAVASPVRPPPREAPTAPPAGVLFFETDAYRVAAPQRALLEQAARFLSTERLARLRLDAHGDPRVAGDYNRALAAKRAEMVVRELAALGVEPARIEVVVHGRPVPVDGVVDVSQTRRVDLTTILPLAAGR